MNTKQWKAGLLSVAMLASMAVPAAAATPDSTEPLSSSGSVVTQVAPAVTNDQGEMQDIIFAFQLSSGDWHEYTIQVPAVTIPSGSDHEQIVAEGDEACRTWLTENLSQLPSLEDLLSGSGVDAAQYSDVSYSCVKWVDHEDLGGEWHADFTLVEKSETEEPQQAPEFGPVWGPTGESWGISLTLACSNDLAAHKGGNSVTQTKNFISPSDWDLDSANFYQKEGVWYATCSLNAEKLLTEKFGEGHTATTNPELTLIYKDNKWCILGDETPIPVTVEGVCSANSPAVPQLDTNVSAWIQIYLDTYEPFRGSALDVYANRYGDSVSFGKPYQDGDTWLCDMTVVGYSPNEELGASCYINGVLATHPEYTVDPSEMCSDGTATKTVTLTYNQTSALWVAPELPLEVTTGGPGDTSAKVKNGIAFKLIAKEDLPDPNAPEAPNKDNCNLFYVTVYGAVPQLDGSVVNKDLLSYAWNMVNSKYQVEYQFGQPEKQADGTWTCDLTVDATQMVNLVQAEHSTYRIVEEDPSIKTITLTYNENTQKWSAPSDGVTYGYPGSPETKNGVAFQLLQQFSMIFTPGLNGVGEEYASPLYDAGSVVDLPETTDFTRDGYVFAGWKTSIKNGTSSTNYFYPVGTPITVFAQENLELDAYWMNVELSVADTVYDSSKAVKDYNFSTEGVTIDSSAGQVTLLYRATVLGNGYYPYALNCDGAQAVYNTSLSGTFPIATTKISVYFTKTYSVEDTMDIQEKVTMGNAASSVSTKINTASLSASGAEFVYLGDETSYTFTAAGENSDQGTMMFSFLLDGQYVPESVKLEALNGFMMVQSDPVQTDDGMLYKVILTQVSGLNALQAGKQTEVLRVTLTAANEKGQIVLTPMDYSYSADTSGPDHFGQVGAPVISQVWVRYDVNDDGMISLSDVNMIKVYYQAQKGDDNWSEAARADINGDGVVDIEDLSALMQYLLQ